MPEPVDGRLRLEPVKRRELLYKYAVDLFATRGVAAGSHTRIAEKAGVSVATVFNYFSDAKNLEVDVIAHVGDFVEEIYIDIFREADSAAWYEKISASLEKEYKSRWSYFRAWATAGATPQKECYKIFEKVDAGIVELVRSRIELGRRKGTLPKMAMSTRDQATWLVAGLRRLGELEEEAVNKKMISEYVELVLGLGGS
jgi:TetR/AcrR family hemagglutinin/protease transcriptional regulator